jgi:hypothetical protein
VVPFFAAEVVQLFYVLVETSPAGRGIIAGRDEDFEGLGLGRPPGIVSVAIRSINFKLSGRRTLNVQLPTFNVQRKKWKIENGKQLA